MSNITLVNPTLLKVRRDLENAQDHLGVVWAVADHDAIGRLTSATEALMRALASLSYAVERLAEQPACDGSH